ncbi:hypothetical protein NEIG_00320 [Nematocida sp. ERTm5]|nr:hypothetical protein NEIG_00320 [Nematocida sp. ERTm5]
MHIKSICKNIVIIWTSSKFTRNVLASAESEPDNKNMSNSENSDIPANRLRVSNLKMIFENPGKQGNNSNTWTLDRPSKIRPLKKNNCRLSNNTKSLEDLSVNSTIKEDQKKENTEIGCMSEDAPEILITNPFHPDYDKINSNRLEVSFENTPPITRRISSQADPQTETTPKNSLTKVPPVPQKKLSREENAKSEKTQINNLETMRNNIMRRFMGEKDNKDSEKPVEKTLSAWFDDSDDDSSLENPTAPEDIEGEETNKERAMSTDKNNTPSGYTTQEEHIDKQTYMQKEEKEYPLKPIIRLENKNGLENLLLIEGGYSSSEESKSPIKDLKNTDSENTINAQNEFSFNKEHLAHRNKGTPPPPPPLKDFFINNENNLGWTKRFKCNQPNENKNDTKTSFSAQLQNMAAKIQTNENKSDHGANKASTSKTAISFIDELNKKIKRTAQEEDDVSPNSSRRGSESHENSRKASSDSSSLDDTNSIDGNTNMLKEAISIRRNKIRASPTTSEDEKTDTTNTPPDTASEDENNHWVNSNESSPFSSLDGNNSNNPAAINSEEDTRPPAPPIPPALPTYTLVLNKDKNSKNGNMPTQSYMSELLSKISKDGTINLKNKRKITTTSIEKSLPNMNDIELINFNAGKDDYKGVEAVHLTENINMDKDELKKLISDYNFRWLFVNAKDPSKNILITNKSIYEMPLMNVIKEQKSKENEHASLSNRTAKTGYKVYIRKYQANTDQNGNSYLLFVNEKREIQYVINSECLVPQNSESQQFNWDLDILQKKNPIWDSVITISMVAGEKEFISIKGLNEKSEKVLGVASLNSETTQMLLNRLFSKPENLSKEMKRNAMIYQMNLFLNETKTSAFRKMFYAYQLFIGEKFSTSLDKTWAFLVKKYSYYSDKNTTDKHNYTLQYTKTNNISQPLSDAIENYIKYPVEGSTLTLKVGPIMELIVSKEEKSQNKKHEELIWFKSAGKEIKFVEPDENLHTPVIFTIEICADKNMKFSIYGENSECIYQSKENKGQDTKQKETNTIKSILSNNWMDKELLVTDRIPINDESSIFIFQLLKQLNESKYAKNSIPGL